MAHVLPIVALASYPEYKCTKSHGAFPSMYMKAQFLDTCHLANIGHHVVVPIEYVCNLVCHYMVSFSVLFYLIERTLPDMKLHNLYYKQGAVINEAQTEARAHVTFKSNRQ